MEPRPGESPAGPHAAPAGRTPVQPAAGSVWSGRRSRPGRVDPSPRFQDRRRGSSPDVDQSAGDKRIAATDELTLGPTPVEGRRRHRRLETQGTRASRIERRGTEPRRPGGAARGCRGPGLPEGPRNRPTHRFALRVASNADQSFGRAPARGKGGVSSPAVWRRLRGPGGHAWYSTQRRRPKAASSDVSRRRRWRRDTRKESRCPHHLGAWAAQAGTPAPSAPARRWLPPRLVSTKASVRCTVPVRPRPASAVEAGTTQNLVSTTAVGGPTHAGAARFARQAAGTGWARSSVGTNRSTTFHVKRLAPTGDGAGSSNPWDRNAGDPRWLISLQPGQRQQAPLALDRPGRPGERGSGGAGMGAG